MIHLIIRLIINAIALWVAIQIVPGLTYQGGTATLLIIALIFGVVNALVRPFILLLTCPPGHSNSRALYSGGKHNHVIHHRLVGRSGSLRFGACLNRVLVDLFWRPNYQPC